MKALLEGTGEEKEGILSTYPTVKNRVGAVRNWRVEDL